MPGGGRLGHLDADPARARTAKGDLEGDRDDAPGQRGMAAQARRDGPWRTVLAAGPKPQRPDGLPCVGRPELDVVELGRFPTGQRRERRRRIDRVQRRDADDALLEVRVLARKTLRPARADEHERVPEPLELDGHVGVGRAGVTDE